MLISALKQKKAPKTNGNYKAAFKDKPYASGLIVPAESSDETRSYHDF